MPDNISEKIADLQKYSLGEIKLINPIDGVLDFFSKVKEIIEKELSPK